MQRPHSPITCRSVDFYPVHLLVAPILTTVESWPVAGTLDWHNLTDTDPRKWCAVLDAAQYGVLHMQMRQEASIEASKSIAAGGNWGLMARQIAQGQRPWGYIKEIA
jgi:hypothetical protein